MQTSVLFLLAATFPSSALLSSHLSRVASPCQLTLGDQINTRGYSSFQLRSTLVDLPSVPTKTGTTLQPRIRFNITPVKWIDLMSVVSLRVTTFYPELCEPGKSNEAMKQSIKNTMIDRANEGSMNFMASEDGGFFNRNLLGAVEVSPADFRGTTMERVGAKRKLYLVDLCIKNNYRKMGIASSLLAAVDGYAREKDFSEIYMHVEESNSNALSLYRKCGYTVVPPYDWAISFTEFRLRRPAEGYMLLVKSLREERSTSARRYSGLTSLSAS